VSVAVMYAHGLSYVIEVHAAVPALGLALGALLEWRPAGRVARDAVVLVFVVATLALCSTQRYMWPYAWWGWQEPSIAKAVITPQTPLLRGFLLSPRSDGVYAGVTAIIRQAVLPGDWVYCFPSIPLFYVTSGVYPRTEALVAYWDVCPDDVARRDAATLLADPPVVIVDLHMEEPVWRFHEVAFRGGRPSGQRAIARAINVLTSGDRYGLVMDVPTYNYSSLRVWVRADRHPRRLGIPRPASNHTGVASPGRSGSP